MNYSAYPQLRTGMWAGRPAFVVGSGPSRRGLDLGVLLKDQLSIGCNEEYRWGPTISLCQDVRFFFGDGTPNRLPAKDNPAWYGRSSIPVFFRGHPDRPDPPYDDYGLIVEINAAHHPGKEGVPEFVWGKTLEEGIYYGANCGLAALNLADILGANPIYLVGFDCADRDGRAHGHDYYPAEWEMAVGTNEDVYRMWARDFDKIAPFVKARVVNLCTWSGITAFMKAPVETIHALV